MSAAAIAKVRQLWEKLQFARVTRTVAREPEDVLSIHVHRPSGHEHNGQPYYLGNPEHVRSNRISDVKPEDRPHARVAWRHFYGFTTENIYFQRDNYCELDFDIDLTADFSSWGNHMGGHDKRPQNGDLIAGTVVNTPQGKRFTKWFILTPQLRFLIELVRAEETT